VPSKFGWKRRCVTWIILTCDVNHWHLFTYGTRFIHLNGMVDAYVWHDSFMCVTWVFIRILWLMHMFDTPNADVWHESFIRGGARLIHPNLDGTIYAYEYHDWFTCFPWLNRIYATWHICKCDMTHSYMKPASFIQVTWRVHTSSMTHSYTWYD